MPPKVVRRKAARNNKLTSLPEYDGRSQYDWEAIRTAYIEGQKDEEGTIVWPTPKELEIQFKVPYKQLTNRIAAERWKDWKDAHKREIALNRQRDMAKRLAGKAVKFDEQALEAAETAQQLILDRLSEISELKELDKPRIEQLRQRVADGEIIEPRELRQSVVGYSELESLGKAFAAFNEVGRKALGIEDGQAQPNVEVTNTTISQIIQTPDPERIKGLMSIVGNKNFTLMETVRKEIEAGQAPEEEPEEEEEVVDAEVEGEDYHTE